MTRKLTMVLLIIGISFVLVAALPPHDANTVQTPVLKWQNGGCYSSWCETGWYSSPAVADLDGDGTPEVIGGAYSIFALNGEDGSVQWQTDTPGSRVWAGVVVADIDDDGVIEIVSGHGGGYLNVLNRDGSVRWTVHPIDNEFRGLSVFDLDADGTLEIIATAARGSKTNAWVYEHNSVLRAGWPRLPANAPESAWGTYNDNAGIGDVDGDGDAEVIVPSDVHSVCAYEPDGTQMPANEIYHAHAGETWGAVGVHVDHAVDLRGYAHCGTEHRPNFAGSPATLADVNGDGSLEIIVVGNIYNCGTSPYTDLYEMPFIFNADRTRWAGNGFDWEVIPTPDGNAAPLSEDYNLIENNHPNPVVADLDGDGFKEILYPSYDGRIHAFWLDKTEHGNWPFSVYNAAEGFYRFASEPVVADLDNDGHAEVIFATWAQKGTHQTGALYILDYLGNVLQSVALPAAYSSSSTWNGVLAAPTLANIDSDADLEVVLNTAHSGFAAYDLPDTANARILWGTGRGNYQRSGSPIVGSLENSSITVTPIAPHPGDVMTYTIVLQNSGPALPSTWVTATLSPLVTPLGNLSASAGSFGSAGRVITWTGNVLPSVPITITYGATLNVAVTEPSVVTHSVEVDDGINPVWQASPNAIANAYLSYLPIIFRE